MNFNRAANFTTITEQEGGNQNLQKNEKSRTKHSRLISNDIKFDADGTNLTKRRNPFMWQFHSMIDWRLLWVSDYWYFFHFAFLRRIKALTREREILNEIRTTVWHFWIASGGVDSKWCKFNRTGKVNWKREWRKYESGLIEHVILLTTKLRFSQFTSSSSLSL